MKNYFLILIMVSAASFMKSCTGAADVNEPRGSKTPPAQVTNVSVRNISGASIISYDRPDDPNLKYVQAAYTSEIGEERTFNASFYTDTILVNGFARAGEYDVRLYSVSYGEAKSEPVTVKVNPTNPAYLEVLENSEITATFGGFNFISVDEAASDLSIIFLKRLESEWQEIGAYYTKKTVNLACSIRGQEAEETEFGAYISDRWGHRSDTLRFTLVPWFEEELPKSKFKTVELPTDNYTVHNWSGSNNSVAALWDGKTSTDICYHTKTTDPMPQWFTFDLGEQYSISRMLFHGRTNANKNDTRFVFAQGMPLEFELWGCNTLDPAGDWDTWTLIDTFVAARADGSTNNQDQEPLVQADLDLIVAGHNFDFPMNSPKYRYIRFKTNSTYGGLNSVMIGELTFYGQ